MEEHCHRCRHLLTPETEIAVKGRNIKICRECAEEKYLKCDVCQQYVCEQDLVDAESRSVCIWCLCDQFILCPHCGSFVSTGNAVRFHGHWLCKDCRNEYFRTCDGCHQEVEEDELEEVQRNGKTVSLCRACRKGKYLLCDECREWYPADSVLHWRGHTYCRECAADDCAVCDSCRETVAATEMETVTVDGKNLDVCSNCFHNQYCNCDCCGKTFLRKKLYIIELGHYCEECLQKIRETNRLASLNALGAAALGIAAGAALGKALFKPPESDSFISGILPADDDGLPADYAGDGLDGHDDYVGDGLDS